ncbi:AAA family ATPase [Mesorhizobium sp.]|uniref:AAA family ATPase n=1 Tax=Mesorhizobium sp. TaxID=1871066 RepID=UPI000FE57E74|nr:AAA family ATPase [Mesorhizobium sp.]RWK11856.1 MAG: winged helix-turn-helix transcriptional regulator [Mesorhizobium sp.]TIQ49049.1 MAG: winged helix-turn-helix transcriptional regulator [Mesorhizobium sp.]TIQ58872.1 MAG: winged helix-turn-helix transcriptional regulator [Mesorhizobium sp.]
MVEVPLEEAKKRLSGEVAPGGDSNTRYQPEHSATWPDHRQSRAAKHRRRNRDFSGLMSSAAFIALMRPPDYLIDGLLLRGAAYTLTGNAGHCKTLIALLLAIRVARGDWFCGRKCRQGTVAFFCGENPDNVMVQFYSMCRDLEIDPETLPIIWHKGAFDLDGALKKTCAALAAYPDLALCVYDSLQAFFSGEDDNQNMAVLAAAIDFRTLSEGHPNRPTSLILAHPVKNASRDNLLPRGGSALTNELDGNLTCWLNGERNVVTLHWHGKIRGVPFDAIKLETQVIKPAGLVDADGNQMPCTVVRPLLDSREVELTQQSNAREIAILQAVRASPTIPQTQLASLLSVGRSTVQRQLEALKKKKWLRQYPTGFKLTKEGVTALELGAG